jgi:[acyl-carrier-protein] S-malonyltransferase
MSFLALFPGQGSQVVGMGRSLSDGLSSAKARFEQADRVLSEEGAELSLSALCFEGPLEKLTLTRFAQPAILTVSICAFEATKLIPSAAAGHSLGEYSALVAAGVLDFEDAVRTVYRRGKYMQEAVPAGAGKMIAVLGTETAVIEEAIANTIGGVKEIANLNCPGQIVIAGDVTGIDLLSQTLTKLGSKVLPLNVSAPFHCSLMKPAADLLRQDLDAIPFGNPKFPVYSNVSAQAVTSGEQAREFLYRQVASPVRWTESIQNMLAETKCTKSVEFGAGNILSNLLKRIDKSVQRFEVDTAEKASGIGTALTLAQNKAA